MWNITLRNISRPDATPPVTSGAADSVDGGR
jgi:hypothetical protein